MDGREAIVQLGRVEEGRADPADCFDDGRDLAGEIASVPDRLVMERSVAWLPDLVEPTGYRPSGAHPPGDEGKHRRQEPGPEEVRPFVPTAEERRPEAKREARDDVSGRNNATSRREPSGGVDYRLCRLRLLVGLQHRNLVRQPLVESHGGSVGAGGGGVDAVPKGDLKGLERRVQRLAQDRVPEITRMNSDVGFLR